MRLPNAEHAIISIAKLRNYCLNENHKTGKDEAGVFRAALDMDENHAHELQARLAKAAQEEEASPRSFSAHGEQFNIEFRYTRQGKTTMIRCNWIILEEETVPRLTTCYVAKGKR